MHFVIDIETNGIDFTKGDHVEQVTDVWCIVAQDADPGNLIWTATVEDNDFDRMLWNLEKADELIGHNIIQFDLPVLRRLFDFKPNGKITDTLVISRVLYPDRPDGHSLRAWGGRLGVNKSTFDSFDQYSEEMLAYCKRDVEVNRQLYERLQKEQDGHDWQRAFDTEHRIAELMAEQESIGFYFNKNKAQKLAQEWEDGITSLDNNIHSLIHSRVESGVHVSKPFKINGDLSKRAVDVCDAWGIDRDTIGGPFSTFITTPFRLESPKQQKEILLEAGWKPDEFTPTGQPKLNDSIKDVGKLGEDLSARNILSHRRNQVQGLIDLVDDYGRVHGGANPCGTNTGRMRHYRIVNIPRGSTPYGSEIRELFTVPSSKVLLGYDAAGLELRILAHYIGNEEYNEAVTNNDKRNDAHTLAARAAGTDDRDVGKIINYALIYGASDRKLGSIVRGTTADGKRVRDRLYASIPGLQRLINQTKTAAKRGYIISLDGRKLYIRPGKSPLNTLIQGGGAIFMKNVAATLHESAKYLKAFKVLDMHDEAQWEVPPDEVEELTGYINLAFEDATEELQLRCPQEAEVKVGKTWLETH